MAVRFSGSQRLHRTANLPAGMVLSVSGWAQSVSHSGAYEAIATIADNASNPSNAIELYMTSGAALECQSYGGGSDSVSLATITETSPFFWAFVVNGGGTNAVTAYARQHNANTFVTGQHDNTGLNSLGAINVGDNGWAERFSGRVWNVKVWDRALSAAELLVESYYRRPMFPASLNFWWPLDRHNDLNDYGGLARAPTVTGTLTTEDGAFGLWRPRRRIFIPVAAGGGAFTLTAEQGSYALNGQAAAVRAARVVTAGQGTYNLSGQVAGLRRGFPLVAQQGSYALNGQSAALRAARRLVAAAGSHALSGQAAGLRVARLMAAGQGSYSLAGQDAGLISSGAGPKVLTADAGSYSVTGQPAALRIARKLLAEFGSYALTGNDARLARDARIILDAGAYSLTGQAAALRAAHRLLAQHGIYALNGQNVLLLAPVDAVVGYLTGVLRVRPALDAELALLPALVGAVEISPALDATVNVRPDA